MIRIQNIAKTELISLISLIVIMGLMGCSSDDYEEAPVTELGAPVTVNGYVAGYEEPGYRVTRAYGANGITRGWVPPTGFGFDAELADKSISVFFTQTSGEPAGGFEEDFFFKSSDKWRVSKTDLKAENYYLYGYVPHEKYVEAKVEVLPHEDGEPAHTFTDGAVLTLDQLNAVTSADICVIVGAKNGKDDYRPNADYSVTGLKMGDFTYAAQTTVQPLPSPEESGIRRNYVYLLFDHIYAAMRFSIKVNGTYNALRTIKLKDLSLQAYTGDDGTTTTKKKMKATITLTKTTDGSSPISSIVFEDVGTEVGKGSFFEDAAGLELTTDYSDFIGHFMPKDVTKVELTSTYDVYDKQGNLIRQNCTAMNTLDLKKLFFYDSEIKTARRGYRYTVKMTINPTYLYVLSEPDLNNPTVEVE